MFYYRFYILVNQHLPGSVFGNQSINQSIKCGWTTKSCLFKNQQTSRLNSNSASNVQTLTGNDLPDFFLLNGGILGFIFTQPSQNPLTTVDIMPVMYHSY